MGDLNNELPLTYYPTCPLNEPESTEDKDFTLPDTVINTNDEPLTTTCFENDNVRLGFIMKVLSIFLMQTIVLGVIIGVALSTEFMCREIKAHRQIALLLAILLPLSTFVATLYCTQARKQMPLNFIFLAAIPLTSGFAILALTCGRILYEIAAGWVIYFAAALGQLIYTIFCLDGPLKYDASHGFFLTTCVVILGYCILGIAWFVNPMTLFLVTVAIWLESFSRPYRLHLITNNNHNCVTPSDYVNGILCLYSDSWVAAIVGRSKDKGPLSRAPAE